MLVTLAECVEGDWGQVAEYLGDVSGVARLADYIKSNSASLSPELTHHPLVAATLVISLATILGAPIAVDVATSHPIDPNAPHPTGAGVTSAVGELLSGSHLVQIGGLKALNLLLDRLGTHIYIDAKFNPATLPQRDPMKNPDGPRPGTPGEVEGTIGVKFKF